MSTRAVVWVVVWAVAGVCWGQAPPQVTITTPMHSLGHSYFERVGTQWSLRGPGFFARFGAAPAVPPFGRFQPGAGIQGGVGFQGGPWQGQLHFFAGQGARTSFTTVAPSMTVTQGMPGTMFAGTWSPFVVGVVPVVGRPWPGVPYRTPLQVAAEQLSASSRATGPNAPPLARPAAGPGPRRLLALAQQPRRRADIAPGVPVPDARWENDHPGRSLAALRRRNAAQRHQEHRRARELLRQAQQFQAQGRWKTARAFCRAALPLADPETRQQIRRLLQQLGKNAP